MEQTSRPVLGDVFAPVDVLTAQARLELASRLSVLGRAPAILPGELAALALPAAADVLAAVGEAIVAGLGPAAISALRDRRLDTVVPVLRGSDSDIVARSLPDRLLRLVQEHTGATPFVELTVGAIADCPGIGPSGVAATVTATVTAGLKVVASEGDLQTPAGPSPDDVTTVLMHDASGSGVMRGALAEAAASGPPDVRVAAQRLLALGAQPGADRRIKFLDELLVAAGDMRDRVVFDHVVLVPAHSADRRDVAAAIGVGSERLRQLRARAIERVDAAVGNCPDDVRELATSLAGRIGSAAPHPAIDEVLASLGLPALPDSRSRLLLRLAGPYRDIDGHPGWVATDPAELIVETRRMIREDGGVRLAEHVAKELATLGMAGEHVADWLARQPVRVADGLVVATTGTPADVAERALHARGRAMTADELADWLPGPVETVDALWTGRDRRFGLTDSDALALAEWDETPAADDRLNGGERPAGTLRVAVDDDVLGGGRGPIGLALARALGLRRGSRRTFPTRYGPVAVGYDGDMPSRGSIRPVALAVGAVVGEELVIALYSGGREATVSVVPAARPERAMSPTLEENRR